MLKIVVGIFASIIPMIPVMVYFLYRRTDNPVYVTKNLLVGMKVFNVMVFLMALGLGVVWLASPSSVFAAGLAQAATGGDQYASLAAAISTGLATVGAGIAVSGTGAAAVGAIAEKPEAFGRSLIFVGLAEGIAIYGLIIAFLVLNR